jgi:hypothetical protein
MRIYRTDGAGSLLSVLAIVALALAGGGGCASQGEKMVDSFTKTRETVAGAQRKVDATLLSLHQLRSTPAPELKDGFGRYKEAVRKLEEEGADVKWDAVSLQGDAEAHIKQWEKEMETLKDPTIKASMESRRQAVRSNYKVIKLYSQDSRKAYDTYLAGNKQIVQALSIDLSPAAMTSLSPSIDRVLSDGGVLKERLGATQNALNNIANGISPLGETQ